MQSIEVKSFKNELRNYNFYLSRLKKLDEMIEFCYSLLPGNVHGIDLTQPVSHGTLNKDREYRIRDEISRHEIKKATTQAKVDEIDAILDQMEISLKTAVSEVFIKGRRIQDVAIEYNLSANALQHRMNRELRRVLNEELQKI